jgi:hypothetical protein
MDLMILIKRLLISDYMNEVLFSPQANVIRVHVPLYDPKIHNRFGEEKRWEIIITTFCLVN